MGAFSCFSCLGGQKDQRLESPEPARQVPLQAQDEKKVSSSRKASNEPEVVRNENAKNTTAEHPPETGEAVSIAVRAASPPPELKLNLPPPASETVSKKDPFLTETAREQQASASADSPALTISRSRSPIPQLIRPISSSSSSSSSSHRKSSSQGSSLKQTSTKATSPPQTPVEKEANSVPAAQVLSPQNESPDVKTDEVPPTSAETAPPVSPQLPSPKTLPETIDLKTIEAFSTTPSTCADTKPTLDIKTTSPLPSPGLIHRPSFEDDTPITPSTTDPLTTTTATTPDPATSVSESRPSIKRLSTAPASLATFNPLTKSKTEKRKSRLSRFLSVSSGKDKEQKPARVVGVQEADRSAVLVEEAGEAEAGKEKTSWEKEVEKEVERVKVEGRKWREEGDNESLFCY